MRLLRNFLAKLGYFNVREISDFVKELAESSSKSTKAEILAPRDEKLGFVERSPVISFSQMYYFYKHNEWVRACVDLISGVASRAQLVVKPKTLEEELSEETKRHIQEVENLLYNPNSRDESLEYVRRKIIRDLLIYDAAAMEIVYDEEGKPYELYDLPGYAIRINVDEHGNFKNPKEAYKLVMTDEFGRKKVAATFAYNELIYFAMNVGAGGVYGLSPLETLVDSIRSDINAAKYNASFFENNALPSGIVSIPGLGEKQLELFAKQWKKMMGGSKNAHKLAFINNEKISFQKLSESAKDMQFIEYQRWILNKILAVYKVTPFVLGLVDETTGKLNSQEQWSSFIEKAVKPILKLEQYLYNTKLIQVAFGYDDIEVEFLPVTETEETDLAETVDLIVKSNVMSINEIRKKYFGLEEVPWGDVPYDLLRQGILSVGSPQKQEQKEAVPETAETASEAEDSKQTFTCECLNCGYVMESDQHCRDIKCPKCGGEMRRKERPGPGKSEQPPTSNVILCRNCGHSIDVAFVSEESMGTIRCPNCGALLDQEGNVLQSSSYELPENEALSLRARILNIISQTIEESKHKKRSEEQEIQTQKKQVLEMQKQLLHKLLGGTNEDPTKRK